MYWNPRARQSTTRTKTGFVKTFFFHYGILYLPTKIFFQHPHVKQRYEDVLPLASTAVKLQPINGALGSDYINANFVEDRRLSPVESKKQKYICCQAPLANTVADFWRMIWEQNVTLVVMITNLKENAKMKADPYWPSAIGDVRHFGRMRVKLLKEKDRGIAMIRHFSYWLVPLKASSSSTSSTTSSDCEMLGGDDDSCEGLMLSDDDEGEEEPPAGVLAKTCVQLHCTQWPDFGVMDSLHLLLPLIREIDLRKRFAEEPVLVHCSAGIGRTGTLLAILMSLHRELMGEVIHLKDTVLHLRSMRMGSIQSPAQYKFVYQMVSDLLLLRGGYTHPSVKICLDGINPIKREEKVDKEVDEGEEMQHKRLEKVRSDLTSSVNILRRYQQYKKLRNRARSWHGETLLKFDCPLDPVTNRKLRRRSEKQIFQR
eukprot:TRINITY_DN5091_c0_g1_i6.p1 TRINITY_DN5091_c0_g1~~TRINITY_DN5091_c0_g1_i6.p1  ORF type:complete len:428 (-),score=84.85 TRINITY_DN5091_c0_g1_i6:273-1556(-)